MQIEKNIAATLRSEMERQGKTLMEFSTELGIPRSTLQGYLKGTSHPRADSMEELAYKLGISLADLVSGGTAADMPGSLDAILLEAQALHPCAVPVVEDVVSLLRSVFRLSDDLYDLAEGTVLADDTGKTYRYFLHELRNPFHRGSSYGILVKERLPGGWITVAVAAGVSRDRAAVSRLIKQCTELQLAPEHLFDVIHDFLVQAHGNRCPAF